VGHSEHGADQSELHADSSGEPVGLIVDLKFTEAKDGKAVATIKSVVKGKTQEKTVTMNLASSAYKEHAQAVEKMINELGDSPVLFFEGRSTTRPRRGRRSRRGAGRRRGREGVSSHARPMGGLLQGKRQYLEMDAISSPMLGTWNGGTDMLRKVVEYILEEPDA